MEYSDPETILGCVLTNLRSILNERSTGLHILATAFIRYILVCHPTSNYLTDIKLRLIAGSIVVLSCLPLVGNLVDMKFNLTSLIFAQVIMKTKVSSFIMIQSSYIDASDFITVAPGEF